MTNDKDYLHFRLLSTHSPKCFAPHFLLIMTTVVIVPILGKWTPRLIQVADSHQGNIFDGGGGDTKMTDPWLQNPSSESCYNTDERGEPLCPSQSLTGRASQSWGKGFLRAFCDERRGGGGDSRKSQGTAGSKHPQTCTGIQPKDQ